MSQSNLLRASFDESIKVIFARLHSIAIVWCGESGSPTCHVRGQITLRSPNRQPTRAVAPGGATRTEGVVDATCFWAGMKKASRVGEGLRQGNEEALGETADLVRNE